MLHALSRLRGWLRPAPPKPRPASGSARAQLHRIEYKIDRISYHLTRAILHLPTSGLMESSPLTTSAGSTATPAATPMTASVPGTASTAPQPLLKHGKKYAPKVAGWLAEHVARYLWSLMSGAVLSALAAIYKWWQEIWAVLTSWATWLLALVV